MKSNHLPKEELFDRRSVQNADPFIADDLLLMEEASNYNQWLYELVLPYIGKRVLEIGSGTGTMSKKIVSEVDLLVGVEPNEFCKNILIKNLGKNPKYILINKRLEDCDFESLKIYKFDTVLCINVLEHIENDIDALNLFEKVLNPDGRVILLVPAFPQAYGPIDKAVGHFRRYSKSSIKFALSKTSLKVENIFYSNFLGLLGWFYNSKIRRSKAQDGIQIKIFNQMTPVISKIERKFGTPLGLSLICVFKVEK